MNLATILLASPFIALIIWVLVRELLYNSEKISPKTKHKFLRIHDDLDYNYFKQVIIHPDFTVKSCSFCSNQQTVKISQKNQQEDKEFLDFLKSHNILADYIHFMSKKAHNSNGKV